MSGATKTTSEEFDDRQQTLAEEAGEAYQQAVRYMIDEVATDGAMATEGDYIVGVAVEEAEGLYEMSGDGELSWTEPADDENCHVEVAVADAADGRFVPDVDVTATLTAPDGTEVGPFEPAFLWHPGLYHYGQNVHVPDGGEYTVEVHVDPPTFARHDEQNGDRYEDAADVTFEGIQVEPGQS